MANVFFTVAGGREAGEMKEKGEDLSSGFEGMTMATSNYVLNG